MANTWSRIRKWWRYIAPNAVWDLVKWVGGSSMMASVGHCVWLEYHRRPVDWWWLACLMGGGLFLAVIGFWQQARRAEAAHVGGFLDNAYDEVSIQIMPNTDPALALFHADQIEAFSIARGLATLLSSLPIEPSKGGFDRSIFGSGYEEQIQMMTAYSDAVSTWSNRLGHAYVDSKLSERVTNLTHKLGARQFDVSNLEPYCKWMGSGDNVRAAIDELWRLAKEMEQP